jgi:hypothetical protein
MLHRTLITLCLVSFFSEIHDSWAQPGAQQVVPGSTGNFVPIYVALIGFAASLIGSMAGILIKDIYIHRANTKLAKADTQRDVIRNYISPLSSTCEKLIWRFKEIFLDNRPMADVKHCPSPIMNIRERVRYTASGLY